MKYTNKVQCYIILPRFLDDSNKTSQRWSKVSVEEPIKDWSRAH